MRSGAKQLAVVGVAVVAALYAVKTWGAGPLADISKPGTYTSGSWKYCLVVTLPGSKSEGTRGELFYNGRPVPHAAPGDYYSTPWGDVQWVGDPGVLWGTHGWMLRRGGSGGRRLDEPWREAGGPVVTALLLLEVDRADPKTQIAPWVRKELERLGAKAVRAERTWFPLADQAVTLHDTKRYGTLTARLAPARQADTLTVILDGSRPELVELPRKTGATRLVKRHLGGALGELKYFLALRVDQAAPNWPRPLDVGPEANGKQVVVRGVREVVIALPGDRDSGLVWVVKRVQGDAPRFSSVRVAGAPQFMPALGPTAGLHRAGTFENILSVCGTGKSYVDMELKRTWQSDVPPAKRFTVTLDVQTLAAPGPK